MPDRRAASLLFRGGRVDDAEPRYRWLGPRNLARRLRWWPNAILRRVLPCSVCRGAGMENASMWTDYGYEHNAYHCSMCDGAGHRRPFWRGASEWWGRDA